MLIDQRKRREERRGERWDHLDDFFFFFFFFQYFPVNRIPRELNIKEEKISVHRWSHASSVVVVRRRTAEEGSRLRERELHRWLAAYSRVHRYAGSVATDFRRILEDGVGAEGVDHRYDYESRWTWSREYRYNCVRVRLFCILVAVIFLSSTEKMWYVLA